MTVFRSTNVNHLLLLTFLTFNRFDIKKKRKFRFVRIKNGGLNMMTTVNGKAEGLKMRISAAESCEGQQLQLIAPGDNLKKNIQYI